MKTDGSANTHTHSLTYTDTRLHIHHHHHPTHTHTHTPFGEKEGERGIQQAEKEVVSRTKIREVVNGEAVYLILHCHHQDPDPGGVECGGCIPNPALSPPQ